MTYPWQPAELWLRYLHLLRHGLLQIALVSSVTSCPILCKTSLIAPDDAAQSARSAVN
jgi:hypothetical protein